MRRHALGIIAGLSIAVGVGMLIYFGWNESRWSMAASICLRAGLTLGAVWLAFPQVTNMFRRVPPMLLVGLLLSIVAVIVYPRSFFVVVPVVGALLVLQFLRWLFAPPTKQPKKKTKKKPTAPAKPPASSAADVQEPAER
jgi:hypothetical protein